MVDTYAVDAGWPPSIILGRPWPRPGEALYLPEDTEKVLAVLNERADTCRRCGTRREEWLDADGRRISPDPYEAQRVRCPGCATTEEEDQRWARDTEPALRTGGFIQLRPTPPADDV